MGNNFIGILNFRWKISMGSPEYDTAAPRSAILEIDTPLESVNFLTLEG